MRSALAALRAFALASTVALAACRASHDSQAPPLEGSAARAGGTIEFGLVVEQAGAARPGTADYPHWDSEGSWAVPHEAIWTLEQPLLVCRVARALRTIDELGFPAVDVALVPADGKVFEEFTRRVVGRRLAVLVDGKVVLTPRVGQPLTGRFELGGGFSEDDVRRLLGALEPSR